MRTGVVAAAALVGLGLAAGSFITGGSDGTEASGGPPRAILPAVAADSAAGDISRPFAMGFVPFPYAATTDAVEQLRTYIRTDADLVVMHFDGGIPWQAAMDGSPFPQTLRDDVTHAVASAPSGHMRVLQFTPISFSRDGLAPEPGTGSLASPWSERDFDHPEVAEAFLNYARWLIGQTSPAYVAYGIEANLLYQNGPAHWQAYLVFLGRVYPVLRAEYPGIPFFISIQADAVQVNTTAQAAAIRQLLPYTDILGVSTYAYLAAGGRVADVPPGLLSGIAALDPARPFAISETGWPAEAIGPPVAVSIPSDEAEQAAWMDRVIGECALLRCAFINWFVVRDYDELYEQIYAGGDPGAATLARLWRDIGLYSGTGEERPALRIWREWLSRPRQ